MPPSVLLRTVSHWCALHWYKLFQTAPSVGNNKHQRETLTSCRRVLKEQGVQITGGKNEQKTKKIKYWVTVQLPKSGWKPMQWFRNLSNEDRVSVLCHTICWPCYLVFLGRWYSLWLLRNLCLVLHSDHCRKPISHAVFIHIYKEIPSSVVFWKKKKKKKGRIVAYREWHGDNMVSYELR